jgi:FMN phosphatase YigB (HAD superfamily)
VCLKEVGVIEKKIKALLLDLDDTLLINDMDSFAPYYYKALVARVQGVCPPKAFMDALDMGTRAIFRNNGKGGTNAQVFHAEFFARLRCRPEELLPVIDDFYAHDFDALKRYTEVDPLARVLVELAFARHYQVAIATQPIFPLVAIQARLRWANVGVEDFPYDYVASYETCDACKPQTRYFLSILERLGRRPEECLMVGDSLEADMPAHRLGIKTFWVDQGRLIEKPEAPGDVQGSLADLIALLETGRINDI